MIFLDLVYMLLLQIVKEEAEVCLSSEHSEYNWFDMSDLSDVQRLRVKDALEFNGQVMSRAF